LKTLFSKENTRAHPGGENLPRHNEKSGFEKEKSSWHKKCSVAGVSAVSSTDLSVAWGVASKRQQTKEKRTLKT
jgi:hypothetical protein